MTQTTYVIRKSAYGYSDEYYYERSLGAITDTFTDKDAAYQRLTALEAKRFRQFYDWGDIEQLSSCGYVGRYQTERLALDKYLKEEFGESFLKKKEDSEYLYVPQYTPLPVGITDEQIMKIREITGIRFYEMSVFEGTPMFYAIWFPHKGEFYSTGYSNRDNAIYFYNTYDEALAYASNDNFYRHFSRTPFEGTLEDLSDQPGLLKSFIDTTEGITYNKDQKAIVFDYKFRNESIASFNALLKKPLFEIREFSYEQAKAVPHDPFEYM